MKRSVKYFHKKFKKCLSPFKNGRAHPSCGWWWIITKDWDRNVLLCLWFHSVPVTAELKAVSIFQRANLKEILNLIYIQTPKSPQQSSKPKSSPKFLDVSVTSRLLPLDLGDVCGISRWVCNLICGLVTLEWYLILMLNCPWIEVYTLHLL